MDNNAAIKRTAAGYFNRRGDLVPKYSVVMNHFGLDKNLKLISIDVSFDEYYSVFLKEHNRLSNLKDD